jgi:hypothetical protein
MTKLGMLLKKGIISGRYFKGLEWYQNPNWYPIGDIKNLRLHAFA